MGYGHMRAAAALADALGTEVARADGPPLASTEEERSWDRLRDRYEGISRATEAPVVGGAMRRLLDKLTDIPSLGRGRDLSRPVAAVHLLRRMARNGLGAGLVEHLRATGRPLLSTFYSPAVIAAEAGLERVACVVTDSDIHRVWVPHDPQATAVTYFAPSLRAVRRLAAHGVPAHRVHLTGFPLPPSLLGGQSLDVLRDNLRARIGRLDAAGRFTQRAGTEITGPLRGSPDPGHDCLRVTLAIGGAGAQVRAAGRIVESLAPQVREGGLRLALVAGTRQPVAQRLHEFVRSHGVEDGTEILVEAEFDAYRRRFEGLLADTDLLWTKPSEMTFFAALGLPLLLAEPLGAHERANRRLLLHRGAAFDAGDPATLGERLRRGLLDGGLAAAAWNGFRSLPKRGTYRILAHYRGD